MVAAAADTPVVVTGIGLVTALGFGVEATWDGLLAGRSGIAALPPERFALPVPLPVRLGAAVPRDGLQARIRDLVPRSTWNTAAPVCHLWLLAALEALAGSGLWHPEGGPGLPDADQTGIYVGTGGGAHGFAEEEYIRIFTAERPRERDVSRFAVPMYMASSLAGQLSLLTGARGPGVALNSACSSGSSAILTALDALRLGRVRRAVVGGADLTLSAATVRGFHKLGALCTETGLGAGACRPYHPARSGLVLGEGAAALVLERADAAAERGATPLARVLGGAAGSEAHHLLAPREAGTGMAATMTAALAEARLAPQAVLHVYAHGTGTDYNDACEAQALQRVLPHAPTVSASKAQLGHTMGAAGAIDAVLAVLSLRQGRVPPQRHLEQPAADCPLRPAREVVHPGLAGDAGAAVLVNAFAFGGHNVCLLLGGAADAASPATPRESAP